MGSLRSAIDELRTDELDVVSDEALEDDFVELERSARALQAERDRRLAEIRRRKTWRRDGYLSGVAWLAHRLRIGPGAALRWIREAEALEDMRITREALADGEISPCAVTVLVGAKEAHPTEFDDHEPELVEAARALSVRELRRLVAYWRQALDGPKALENSEFLWELRKLHVSPTLEGMVRVDGDLDPETGQTVIAALRAVMDAEQHDDGTDDRRTSTQRRADALGEVCRQWLDGSDRPSIGGERPHVTVTVDLEALRGGVGVTSEFDDAGPIHPEVARKWACDASVSRLITRGRSEPLDVGRKTAAVPAPLRRAVVQRDRHCRFPGCDRPHPWCDAHHVVHWADGGPTALSNLVLLCRRHHRLVHDPGGFRLELTEDGPRFSRPDGTRLEDRAPP